MNDETLRLIFIEGEIAGEQGYRRNQNPFPKGTQAHEWWAAGWSNSYDELCGGAN